MEALKAAVEQAPEIPQGKLEFLATFTDWLRHPYTKHFIGAMLEAAEEEMENSMELAVTPMQIAERERSLAFAAFQRLLVKGLNNTLEDLQKEQKV